MTQKFYFHDAATGNTGTLPSSENSSLTSNASATPPTGNTTQRSMDGTIGTGQTSAAGTTEASTTAQAMLFRMFESLPLAAQTIGAGSWSLHLGAQESAAAANFRVTACVYVWRPSTGAVVGTILDHPANTLEAGTAESSVTATLTGSSVTCLDGDILVCELWRASLAQGNATARVCTVYYDGTTEDSTTDNAAYLDAPADIALFSTAEDSSGLELSGFGSFSEIGPLDTINHVQVDIAEFQSVAGNPCTFELWDSNTAQIGSTNTGTASTSTSNVSTALFTGVTYSQLSTLRVRVYAHVPSGETESVGSVSLTVNYTPSPDASVTGVGAAVTAAGGIGSATATTGSVDGTVTGVGANVTVAGGVGSVTSTANQSIAGVSASVAVQGGIGSAAGSGIVTGQSAAITVAGGVGSVTAIRNVAIVGVGAQVIASGGIGSPSTTESGIISGTAASVIVQGGIGSVTATANQSVAGVGASVSVAGGIGSVSTGASGIVTGVSALVNVTGGTGSVTATANASIAGVGASVTVVGGIGSASTGAAGIITGVAATISVAGGIGSITASASITGIGASVSVAGGIGSATTTHTASVAGVAASITVAGGIGFASVHSLRPPAALGGTIVQIVYSGIATKIDSAFSGTAMISSYSGTVAQFPYSGVLTQIDPGYGGSTSRLVLGGTVIPVSYSGTLEGWTMQVADITLLEHNDETIDVVIKKNGSNLDLTGYTIEAFLKTASSVADDDASTIKLSTTTGEITITDATNGAAEVVVPATDLNATTVTFWRLDVILSSKRNTVFSGAVTVTPL